MGAGYEGPGRQIKPFWRFTTLKIARGSIKRHIAFFLQDFFIIIRFFALKLVCFSVFSRLTALVGLPIMLLLEIAASRSMAASGGAEGPVTVENSFDAGWSSLVARRAHNPKVVGSNPAPATN